MQQVKLNEAITLLPSLVDAAVRGEVVLITTDDQLSVVELPSEVVDDNYRLQWHIEKIADS